MYTVLLDVPPKWSPSRVMQAIKGKSSHHLLQDHRRLRKEFWGRHLWARGYFAATTGNVSEDMVAEYIGRQDAEPENDRFKVSEQACSGGEAFRRLQSPAKSTAFRRWWPAGLLRPPKLVRGLSRLSPGRTLASCWALGLTLGVPAASLLCGTAAARIPT